MCSSPLARWPACNGRKVFMKDRPKIYVTSSTSKPVRWLSSPSSLRAKQQIVDRDVVVSVLEAAATRRDAKGYLQKYTAKREQHPEVKEYSVTKCANAAVHVAPRKPIEAAIVKLRCPQQLPSHILHGIAKTLTQLRILGLTALVVVDCGIQADRQTFEDEALRLCEVLDSFDAGVAKFAESIFLKQKRKAFLSPDSITSEIVILEDRGLLEKALRRGNIVVIPSVVRPDELASPVPAEAEDTTLALTKYLTGLQVENVEGDSLAQLTQEPRSKQIADIERIIILDPVGGVPMADRSDLSHRLINLEQEYETLLGHLKPKGTVNFPNQAQRHVANLTLAKDTLSFLPSSSSALITTPVAAANCRPLGFGHLRSSSVYQPLSGFDSMVTTRAQKNPLLHNLLTNRPAFSPSLPLQRIQDKKRDHPPVADAGSATLVKRGMPVTMYPDPRIQAWCPAKPGSSRPRLTDRCIDLPRLVHLIEDSFNRRLDLRDYLERLHDNLAGIIIAGQYEGAAILTWERPSGIAEQDAFEQDRFVPYLDKFAVLKSSQGSSGVADIVFNAMVQDCFSDGVCWRSRKDNPVNKWYFERSVGTRQLPQSKWAMFWTTSNAEERSSALQDYESVCREVVPSWAD